MEGEIKALASKVHAMAGIQERSLGLSPAALWDLTSDWQALREEGGALQVRCRCAVALR